MKIKIHQINLNTRFHHKISKPIKKRSLLLLILRREVTSLLKYYIIVYLKQIYHKKLIIAWPVEINTTTFTRILHTFLTYFQRLTE